MTRLTAMATFLLVAILSSSCASAFTLSSPAHSSRRTSGVMSSSTFLAAKKSKEDLSFIETRDMTREEMFELNKQNEEVMNRELALMTGFSLILSLPILYLCWVAFFSD